MWSKTYVPVAHPVSMYRPKLYYHIQVLTYRPLANGYRLNWDGLHVEGLLIGLAAVLEEGPLQPYHRHIQGWGGTNQIAYRL